MDVSRRICARSERQSRREVDENIERCAAPQPTRRSPQRQAAGPGLPRPKTGSVHFKLELNPLGDNKFYFGNF